MIDVLLVLLIIFMVIQPTTPKGLDTLVPPPAKPQASTPPPDNTIVLQVQGETAAPTYRINERSVSRSDLAAELAKIYATRQEKVLFVKGDKALEFGPVAEAISLGHGASVNSIGLITPRSAADR